MDRSVSVSNVDVQTKRCVPNLLLRSAYRWQPEHLADIVQGSTTSVYVHNGRSDRVTKYGKRMQALPFHRRAKIIGVRSGRVSGIVGQ